VAAPVIVLDRERQTLVARSTDAAEPVKVVLLSAGGPELGRAAGNETGPNAGRDAGGKSAAPTVIRVRGGDLKYSDAEHKAVMHGGTLGSVTAERGRRRPFQMKLNCCCCRRTITPARTAARRGWTA